MIETSSIGSVGSETVSVRSAAGAILVGGAEGMDDAVYDVYGRMIWSGLGKNAMSVSVDPGIYVVYAGSCRAKVIVK